MDGEKIPDNREQHINGVSIKIPGVEPVPMSGYVDITSEFNVIMKVDIPMLISQAVCLLAYKLTHLPAYDQKQLIDKKTLELKEYVCQCVDVQAVAYKSLIKP
jgi:hypothetical protein